MRSCPKKIYTPPLGSSLTFSFASSSWLYFRFRLKVFICGLRLFCVYASLTVLLDVVCFVSVLSLPVFFFVRTFSILN